MEKFMILTDDYTFYYLWKQISGFSIKYCLMLTLILLF